MYIRRWRYNLQEKDKEEEKTRFAKLYKKSLDIGEYLSEEDRKFVESHITQQQIICYNISRKNNTLIKNKINKIWRKL